MGWVLGWTDQGDVCVLSQSVNRMRNGALTPTCESGEDGEGGIKVMGGKQRKMRLGRCERDDLGTWAPGAVMLCVVRCC